MTIIINLFAGPGTGKSTTAAAVFSLLKLHGVNAELVTEYAKDMVWDESYNKLHNQPYIFGKQYHRLWRCIGKVDIIVTDSPILLSIIYGKKLGNDFKKFILQTHNKTKTINFFLKRQKPYQQIGRIQNEKQAKVLDREIKKMLDSNKIDYMPLPGNYTATNTITDTVLKKLGKKCEFGLDCYSLTTDEKIDNTFKELDNNPKLVEQLMVEAGIYDKKGKLTKRYI